MSILARSGCIKTGCDVAFADNETNIYRADAFALDDMIVFRVRVPVYLPEEKADFLIIGPALAFDDTLVAKAENVMLCSKDVQKTLLKWTPEVLKQLTIKE